MCDSVCIGFLVTVIVFLSNLKRGVVVEAALGSTHSHHRPKRGLGGSGGGVGCRAMGLRELVPSSFYRRCIRMLIDREVLSPRTCSPWLKDYYDRRGKPLWCWELEWDWECFIIWMDLKKACVKTEEQADGSVSSTG